MNCDELCGDPVGRRLNTLTGGPFIDSTEIWQEMRLAITRTSSAPYLSIFLSVIDYLEEFHEFP